MLESVRGDGWAAQQTAPDVFPKVSYMDRSQVCIFTNPKLANGGRIYTDWN